MGASLVAETVPDERRVEAATLGTTRRHHSASLASTVNYQIAGVWFVDTPATSRRYVFLRRPVCVSVALRAQSRGESEVWGSRRFATRARRACASCSRPRSAR